MYNLFVIYFEGYTMPVICVFKIRYDCAVYLYLETNYTFL